MAPNKIINHAEAVNLARRYSVQNENDLVMVRTVYPHVICAAIIQLEMRTRPKPIVIEQ